MDRHRLCTTRYCENIAYTKDDKCIDHLGDCPIVSNIICRVPGCINYVFGKYSFTNFHNNDIDNIFCQQHKCKMQSCIIPCKAGMKFCIKHNCKVDECKNRRAFEYHDYCNRHTCKLCNSPVHMEYMFTCIDHKCKRVECMNDIYCLYHMCVICGETNCDHPINKCKRCDTTVHPDDNYCRMHACNWYLCKEPNKYISWSIKGSRFCEQHKCYTCESSINCNHHWLSNAVVLLDYIKFMPKDIRNIISKMLIIYPVAHSK